jgi:CHAT domain-containing protein
MREIARDKAVGRSEALRRAMLALIDSGDPQTAHPGYWAPFIVVGEGRR